MVSPLGQGQFVHQQTNRFYTEDNKRDRVRQRKTDGDDGWEY